MKKIFFFTLLGVGIHLSAVGQAVESQVVFYQQDQLVAAAPATGQATTRLGTNRTSRPGRLSAAPELTHELARLDARLRVPAGWVLYQGVKSPRQNQWVYLERAEVGRDYNLWLYEAATGRKQLLFTQQTSPRTGYAFAPIAWSPTGSVVYLEALVFDNSAAHEGVWAYDLTTGRATAVELPTHYFSTPLLSPDGQQFLYAASTEANPDPLHGTADEVAVFDLRSRTETVVAQQRGVAHQVVGWTTGPALRATDVVPASGELPATVQRVSALAYYLPWEPGRDYYVSRHGAPAPSGAHTFIGSRTTIYDGIGQHSYPAIDFDTPDDADQNVRAAAAGVVTFTGDGGAYGNLVIVTHSDGTRSYYAHNKRILVSTNQQVAAGAVLGLEGTTGRSSGDHIHFEWRAAGGSASTMGTFVNIGQPRQGYQYRSNSPGGTSPPLPVADTQAPTTSISTASTTVAANFAANFADADNVGVAERYYQVLENVGNEWRGNRGNGFFNDNFSALHSDYTFGLADWQGSWAVTPEGRLRQNDLAPTNTAASTFLSQTAGNAYLYHFAARLIGDENTRTGRFGLHIMASDVSLRERGNSYLIWFSANDDKVRIIETVNNVLNERASADIPLEAGSFADYKITYSTNSGVVRVFQNNNLLLSWTDPTPLTSGSYMSLRTNTAQVEFDDLKVYKARGTSQTVTVGAAVNKDLRQASPNASTPAGKIKSLVRDAAGNWSVAGNLDVVVNLPVTSLAPVAFRAAVYPNPLNEATTLTYDLPEAGLVTVAVLNNNGRPLLTLPQGWQPAGSHHLPFPALAKLRSGTYLVRVQAGTHSSVQRVVKP